MKKQQKELRSLEQRLQTEVKQNGEFSKTAIFLRATINVTLKEMGKAPKYTR